MYDRFLDILLEAKKQTPAQRRAARRKKKVAAQQAAAQQKKSSGDRTVATGGADDYKATAKPRPQMGNEPTKKVATINQRAVGAPRMTQAVVPVMRQRILGRSKPRVEPPEDLQSKAVDADFREVPSTKQIGPSAETEAPKTKQTGPRRVPQKKQLPLPGFTSGGSPRRTGKPGPSKLSQSRKDVETAGLDVGLGGGKVGDFGIRKSAFNTAGAGPGVGFNRQAAAQTAGLKPGEGQEGEGGRRRRTDRESARSRFYARVQRGTQATLNRGAQKVANVLQGLRGKKSMHNPPSYKS